VDKRTKFVEINWEVESQLYPAPTSEYTVPAFVELRLLDK
jgi:hypothetical protein